MRYLIVFLCIFLFSAHSLFARHIMADLDFKQGTWAMVAIPTHNYQLLPIQRELKTFITKDKELMKTLQKEWDFPVTFEDKCDYHYELKFYQDGELKKTLKLK